MSGRKPSTKLAAAATALTSALQEVAEAGLDPMDLLNALREPLKQIDTAATEMRSLRDAAVVAVYPDRSRQVYEIADASGLPSAMVTRYAKNAGLTLRNRRLKSSTDEA